MNQTSNHPDWDRVRPLLEGVHATAADLIHWSAEHPERVPGSELEPLIRWLLDDRENQVLFDRTRQFDRSLQEALLQGPRPDPGLANRLIAAVADHTAEPVAVTGHETVTDYQAWLDQQEWNRSADEPRADASGTLPDQGIKPEPDEVVDRLTKPSATRSDGQGRRRWWWAGATTLAVLAATALFVVFFNPRPVPPEMPYTAASLCQSALSWEPDGSNNAAWNADLNAAPDERAFPRHLIRLQARSWKRMEIDGDAQAVVYNLIPEGNDSELKAYVYVFRASAELDLPHQFGFRPTANQDYRVWSAACQQDLVFVLVFEGDEKRMRDLIKVQQVG